jgi:hypothetical protein
VTSRCLLVPYITPYLFVTIEELEALWDLKHAGARGTDPKHHLWALLFLKCYSTEVVHSSIICVNEKMYQNGFNGITQFRAKIFYFL